jgi:hypothetical protein
MIQKIRAVAAKSGVHSWLRNGSTMNSRTSVRYIRMEIGQSIAARFMLLISILLPPASSQTQEQDDSCRRSNDYPWYETSSE